MEILGEEPEALGVGHGQSSQGEGDREGARDVFQAHGKPGGRRDEPAGQVCRRGKARRRLQAEQDQQDKARASCGDPGRPA